MLLILLRSAFCVLRSCLSLWSHAFSRSCSHSLGWAVIGSLQTSPKSWKRQNVDTWEVRFSQCHHKKVWFVCETLRRQLHKMVWVWIFRIKPWQAARLPIPIRRLKPGGKRCMAGPERSRKLWQHAGKQRFLQRSGALCYPDSPLKQIGRDRSIQNISSTSWKTFLKDFPDSFPRLATR